MEKLEHRRLVFFLDALAVVGHRQMEITQLGRVPLDGYRAAEPVVFDRVGQQVDEDLLEPEGVGAEVDPRLVAEVVFDFDLSVVAKRRQLLDAVGDQRVGVDRLDLQWGAVGFDFREVENFVDQLEQMVAAVQDTLDMLVLDR